MKRETKRTQGTNKYCKMEYSWTLPVTYLWHWTSDKDWLKQSELTLGPTVTVNICQRPEQIQTHNNQDFLSLYLASGPEFGLWPCRLDTKQIRKSNGEEPDLKRYMMTAPSIASKTPLRLIMSVCFNAALWIWRWTERVNHIKVLQKFDKVCLWYLMLWVNPLLSCFIWDCCSFYRKTTPAHLIITIPFWA